MLYKIIRWNYDFVLHVFVTFRRLRKGISMRIWHRFGLLMALSALACGLPWRSVGSDQPAVNLPAVSIERIRADVKYLASAELQGRGIGSRGEDLAIEHIAKQFDKAGLKPAGNK